MGLFRVKKSNPEVVKEAEKWVRTLRNTGPEDIVAMARAIKRVEYIKGGGEPYYELVLHDSPATYVEVTTEGMLYVEHRGNYLLFSLDAKKTKDIAQKLKVVGELLRGGAT